MAKCAAITKAESACRAIAATGAQYCPAHDPARAEERRRLASKGGKRAGGGRPLTNLSHIKTQLQDLADGVLDGSIERQDGAVASQILNVLLRAITVELQVKEQQELIERIEALEEAAQTRGNASRVIAGGGAFARKAPESREDGF